MGERIVLAIAVSAKCFDVLGKGSPSVSDFGWWGQALVEMER